MARFLSSGLPHRREEASGEQGGIQGTQAGAGTGRWWGRSLSVAQLFSRLPWAGAVMALAFAGGRDSGPSTLANLVSSHC